MPEGKYTAKRKSGGGSGTIIDREDDGGDSSTVIDADINNDRGPSAEVIVVNDEEETGKTVMKQVVDCSDGDETEDDDEVEFLFQRKLFEANPNHVNNNSQKYPKNSNSSTNSTTDEVEVEFLFQRKPTEVNSNNSQSYSKYLNRSISSNSIANTLFSSSSSSINRNRNVNINLKPKRPLFQRRFNIVKNRHKQNNPKPFIRPSKKHKLFHSRTTYSQHKFSNLELEQEKLFGAAKKKMDEEIKTGVLPQSNSQMPRTEIPYKMKSNGAGSIGGKKMVSVIKKHYKELGLKHLSSLKEVKTKFRELALIAHPDKYKIKAANENVKRLRNERWVRISMAYKEIIDFLKATTAAEEL
jgi:hypothetical protein